MCVNNSHCIHSIGSQQGIYLDWIRSDGGSLPADRDVRDGVLYIRNVQPEAAGVYSCVGISAQGSQVFSADRRLEVVGKSVLLTSCAISSKQTTFYLFP